MLDKILIGKIVAAQGIKGQVRIDFYSEKPENFKKYKNYFFKDNSPAKLKADFFKGKQVIASYEGIKDRTTAESLIGKEIFIEKSALEKPKENEFYLNDLVNLKVIDSATKNELGKVVNTYNFGAGDILEVEFLHREKNKIQMYAFIDEYFPNVNLEQGFIELSE